MKKEPIYIQEIELINFESHKHTVLKGFSKGFNCLAGKSDVGKCLTGDSVIIDQDGSMRTILDMFSQGEWNVPSLVNDKFAWKPVLGIKANGYRNIYEVITQKGRKIKATINHKFFGENGWKELGDFKEGDWIGIAREIPVFGKTKLPQGHARLIGYLLGDGSMLNSVSFTNEEDSVLDDFVRLTSSISPHKFIRRKEGKAVTITVSKPEGVTKRNIDACGLKKFCETYGIYGSKNKNKKIPDILFSCCREDIVDVLLGLLITDGCVRKIKDCNSFTVDFSTTSLKMAEQICHLLTRFGIVSKLRKKKTTWTNCSLKKHGYAYSVDIFGKEFVSRFAKEFGTDFTGKKSKILKEAVAVYSSQKDVTCRYDNYPKTNFIVDLIKNEILVSGKTDTEIKDEMEMNQSSSLLGSPINKSFGMVYLRRLANVLNSKRLKSIANSDLYFDKVKSIEQIGQEPTFDIEVKDSHTFFANDIYTHNTSVLRAIKLASYNEFSDKMVRIGAPFCEVKITTNIGSVYVKRGKGHNKWTVTRNNASSPMEFDKVGKAEVKEACAVLGIKMIQLGDCEIPVNIMDQLEPHFFISSVGGEKTSGSSRAEIIDEICGLNGVEELIKTISLDQYRLTREITTSEERIKELSSKLHSEVDIQRDTEILAKLDTLQSNVDTCKGNIEYVSGLMVELEKEQSTAESLSAQINTIPDTQKADRLLKHTREVHRTLQDASAIQRGIEASSSNLKRIQRDLEAIPEVSGVYPLLSQARGMIGNLLHAQSIFEFISGFENALARNKESLSQLPKDDASSQISEARKAVMVYNAIKQMFNEIQGLVAKDKQIKAELESVAGLDYEALSKKVKEVIAERERAVKVMKDIANIQKEGEELRTGIAESARQIEDVDKQIAELMKMIDVCPVTKKPIGETCSLYNNGKGE